jgi:hypothetical protein
MDGRKNKRRTGGKRKVNTGKKKQQTKLPIRSPQHTSLTRFMLGGGGVVRYRCTTYNFLANVGSQYNSQRFAMNNGYNLASPYSGTLIPVGTSVTNAIYNSMRTVHFHARPRFVNLEAFPYEILSTPSTTDLGTNYSLLLEGTQQRWGKHNTVSSKTGIDNKSMVTSINISKFLGDRIYNTDPGYVGSTSGTAPTKLLYWNWGTFATNNTVSGIEYALDVTVTIKYYNQDFQYTYDQPYDDQPIHISSDGYTNQPVEHVSAVSGTPSPAMCAVMGEEQVSKLKSMHEEYNRIRSHETPVPEVHSTLDTEAFVKQEADYQKLLEHKREMYNIRALHLKMKGKEPNESELRPLELVVTQDGNPEPVNSPLWHGNAPLTFHRNCTCGHGRIMCPSHRLGFPHLV